MGSSHNNQLRKSKTRTKNQNESPYMAQNQNKKMEIRDNYIVISRKGKKNCALGIQCN